MTWNTRALQLATAEVLGVVAVVTTIAVAVGWSSPWALIDAICAAGIAAWLKFKPSRLATGAGLLLLAIELIDKVLTQESTRWLSLVVLLVAAYSAHAKAAAKSVIPTDHTGIANDVCRTCYRRGCTAHPQGGTK